MYIRNNNGPRIEPCGTPDLISINSDLTFPTFTCCFLFDRYEVKREIDLGEK